jgi:hypothetical protein
MKPFTCTHMSAFAHVCLCVNAYGCAFSGMLPGFVSGFYSHDDCHVDLNRLARYAGATLILQPALGLDLQVCADTVRKISPPQKTFLSVNGCTSH